MTLQLLMIWASRRWLNFDRSSRNSKKIKKKWNLGTLPLFHTYYPLRLRNLSYNNWFTHLFTNMNNRVEGSLHVRQMWWIMTISKANIVQMASNLSHGCTMAWWLHLQPSVTGITLKYSIKQFNKSSK